MLTQNMKALASIQAPNSRADPQLSGSIGRINMSAEPLALRSARYV
jgi:hypothetical protein